MLRKMLVNLFFIIVRVLDIIIPKNEKSILFASNGLRNFSGNSKALFDCFLNDNVYTVKYTEIKQSKSKYYINLKSIEGLVYFLRCKYLIGTHGSGDFYYPFGNKKIFIQTWHGTPLKKMGLCDESRSPKINASLKKEFSKINFLLSSSEMVTSSLIRCFGIEEDKILNIGYPRNDKLISYEKKNTLQEKLGKKKIILYAPTFRDWQQTILFPFDDMNYEHLNDVLIQNDAVILIRCHVNDSGQVPIGFDSIVDFGYSKCADISSVLGDVDLLITDYSSIYFDFLLLDRPCLFIPYDYYEYKEMRGFLYDSYEGLMVGDCINSASDLLDSIKINLNNDIHKLRRQNVNHQVNSSQSSDTYSQLLRELKM